MGRCEIALHGICGNVSCLEFLVSSFRSILPGNTKYETRNSQLPRSGFSFSLCVPCRMPPPERTVRQRMIELLIGTRLSSYQLAQMVGLAERLIEAHLQHVVKTLARDRTHRFVLEPAACSDCGFVFRDRTKLTRPSRCPTCRSEGITAPRYGIEPVRK
jgi:transcriptional regulator